jgi:hypothetical protein
MPRVEYILLTPLLPCDAFSTLITPLVFPHRDPPATDAQWHTGGYLPADAGVSSTSSGRVEGVVIGSLVGSHHTPSIDTKPFLPSPLLLDSLAYQIGIPSKPSDRRFGRGFDGGGLWLLATAQEQRSPVS